MQPNSGAQGEFAGLMTIKAYHESRGDHHRKICIIPSSAHGTNPASAVMAGMKVVVTKSSENGNIDVEDLRQKAIQHKDSLAALMVTYPSTHGVYESEIKQITQIIVTNARSTQNLLQSKSMLMDEVIDCPFQFIQFILNFI